MRGIMTPPQSQNVGTAHRFGAGLGEFLSSDKMSPYQEKAISMKEQEIEQANALMQISGIDAQAMLIAGEGGDVDAYYSQFIDLFEQFAPYRVIDGKVLSNIDAAKVKSEELTRTVTDAENEVKLTTTKISKIMADTKLTLVQKQDAAGILEKQIADTVAIAQGRMASGAQELGIINQNLAMEQGVYTSEITKLQALGVRTPEQEERLQLLQTQLNRISTERKAAHAKFGAGLPEDTTEVDTGVAPPSLTSEIEKGDRVTMPVRTDREKGEAFTRSIGSAIAGGYGKALDWGAELSKKRTGMAESVAGALHLPEEAAPLFRGSMEHLSRLLAKAIYGVYSGVGKLTKPKEEGVPRATAISEELLNKSSLRR